MAQKRALFFDMDGVIIDTERDGHRVAFNKAFEHFGYDFRWEVERYHSLLQVAGGKERMRHYFNEEGLFQELTPSDMTEHLKKLHARKTEIFLDMLQSGNLPLRPGVKRFMSEAMELNLTICVCTTANERAAAAVTEKMLAEIEFDHVLAGDVVSKKKPDPEIYLLALEKTGLAPEACIVIEDSAIGVAAARRAGLAVVATTNSYTEREDLQEAAIIVSCLGEPDGERGRLSKAPPDLDYDGVLHVRQVLDCLA